MKRQMSWALLAGGIALAASIASARTCGRGDQRERNGHGHHRDLERVGDPDNVNRDDLIFPEGTMRLLSTMTGGSFSLNPHNCMVKRDGPVNRGDHWSQRGVRRRDRQLPTNTVSVVGLAARDPDGSRSITKPLLRDVEKLVSSGTLSF